MGHGHDLKPGHFHHFEPEQAYHASKLGMWLFLATEIHLFSGLFAAFAYFRWKYPAAFIEYAQQLNWKLGALNTAVLLLSSYYMVRGVDAAQKGDNKKVVKWMNLTFLCAVIFLIVKAFEYNAKFSHHIYPSTHVFWGLYFVMTGIHAFHVIGGMGLILWLRALAKKEKFRVDYYTPVEVCGLYWHIVDAIWIYLFPVVYLLAGIKL